jgi:hypothetical protein
MLSKCNFHFQLKRENIFAYTGSPWFNPPAAGWFIRKFVILTKYILYLLTIEAYFHLNVRNSQLNKEEVL